jgi:hypothetical protein
MLRNRALAVACLFVQANLLMYVFLSAGNSYDTPANTFAFAASAWLIAFVRRQSLRDALLCITAVLLAIFTKWTLAPFAGLVVAGIVAAVLVSPERTALLRWRPHGARDWVVFAALVLALVANLELYGRNLLEYGRVSPRCEDVIGAEACSKHGVTMRDVGLREKNRAAPRMAFREFAPRYFATMAPRLFGVQAQNLMLSKDSSGLREYAFLGWVVLLLAVVFAPRWGRRPEVLVGALVSVGYIAVSVVYNYLGNYLAVGEFGVGLQSRYWFPVLPLTIGAIAAASLDVAPRWVRAPVAAGAALVFLLGGFPFFLSRAGAEWDESTWGTTTLPFSARLKGAGIELTFRPRGDRVNGNVDAVVPLSGTHLQVEGWAMDQSTAKPAASVIAFASRKFVGRTGVEVDRPDVAAQLGQGALRSGFRLKIECDLECRSRRALRVFGVGSGLEVAELGCPHEICALRDRTDLDVKGPS